MPVSGWVELAVRPGCLAGFEKLTGEMVASVQTEGRVFDDRGTLYVHERYKSSEAAAA